MILFNCQLNKNMDVIKSAMAASSGITLTWFLMFSSLTAVISLESFCHNRVKRQLVFPKGSKFFIRINIRENLFTYTTIFAQASGFKMTWDLPDHPHSKKKIHKRDIQAGIVNLLNRYEIDGQNCVNKFACELNSAASSDVAAKLLMLLIKPTDEELSCDVQRFQYCPISVFDLIHN